MFASVPFEDNLIFQQIAWPTHCMIRSDLVDAGYYSELHLVLCQHPPFHETHAPLSRVCDNDIVNIIDLFICESCQ